jgi:hypothetical protein
VPAHLLDLLEFVLELLDCLLYWRFWVPVVLAVAVSILISHTVQEPVFRWILIVPVMAGGVVTGLLWNWKID